MSSISPFKYFVSVTGDCTTSNVGAISVSFTGGTPPYTLQWVDPQISGDQVVTSGPITKTGLGYGNYSVRVNDSTLPQNSSYYINIPISSGVCCDIVSVNDTTCGLSNGSVTGTSSSDFSTTKFYAYTTSGVYVNSAITNNSIVVFNNLSADTYYLLAEDLGGCTGKSQSFIIENSTNLNYGLYVVPNNNCGGFSSGKLYVTGLTGNAPFTYLWSNGQTGSTVTGLTNGEYSVVVTDSNGCQRTKSAIIGTNQPLGLGYFSASTPSCFTNDGALAIAISGGTPPYYYSASTGFAEISYSETFQISNLYAGNYNFLVTDAGLCKLSVGTTLSSPTGITSVNIMTSNSYCSSSDGLVDISIVGGTPPYTYTLITSGGNTNSIVLPSNTFVFTNLSSDTYTIAVYDSNGCGLTDERTIISQDRYTISTAITGTTCGSNNGVITVTVNSGATAPYDYFLDNSQSVLSTALSSVTFTNVSAGNHLITVVDSVGCSQDKNVIVSGSSPIQFSLYSTDCGTGSDGTITSFITSGEPPFTFNWSNNVSGNPQEITVSGLTGGTYSLTLTDANSCSSTRTIFLDCAEEYSSYQVYSVANQNLISDSPTKFGLLEMMNNGFLRLTSGNTNCDLISADFEAVITIIPSGTQLTNIFYTSNSLYDAPTDNEWTDVLTTLISTIPGIENILFDESNNQIIIETTNLPTEITQQRINIELKLMYNIICES